MTIQDVREDLKLIRYYYQRKAEFERMKNVVVSPVVTELVDKYLTAVSRADIQLYYLFFQLYVECYTQEALAVKEGRSLMCIRKQHKKLCEFFANQFNNCAIKVTGKGEN